MIVLWSGRLRARDPERAELGEKPVQSLGCPRVNVPVLNEAAFYLLGDISPLLHLILPDVNEIMGRLPKRLVAHLGRGRFARVSRSLSEMSR